MTSGRNALHRIDASIAEARRALAEINRSAAERSSRLAELKRREAEAHRALATIRLTVLQNEDLLHSLGAVDEKADRLVKNHEEHVRALSERLEDARRDIETLESERRKREEAYEKAVASHEAAVEKTNDRLANDEGYLERAAALEETNAIAERAAAKLELARADRVEKGAPYENDPLFSYLHKRKFGAKDYKAFFLFAALDRWVASLIRYRDARLNYDRLLELPERLSEHAERVEQAAAEIENDLEAYERDALERDGVGKLRDKAAEARRLLDEIDAAIEKAEASHQEVAQEHAAAASGQSGPLEEARQILADAFSRRNIPDLKVLAAETTTLEDDHIVDDLIRLKREQLELEESQRSISRALSKQTDILKELEQLRRKFKSARYDSPYSEFPEGGIVGVILSELMRGAISDRDAWRRVQKAQRKRRRDWSDDFGGEEWRGGFGLPQTGGGRFPGPSFPSPRIPRSRRAPRMPRAPKVRFPRRGGGRFKTGGGF